MKKTKTICGLILLSSLIWYYFDPGLEMIWSKIHLVISCLAGLLMLDIHQYIKKFSKAFLSNDHYPKPNALPFLGDTSSTVIISGKTLNEIYKRNFYPEFQSTEQIKDEVANWPPFKGPDDLFELGADNVLDMRAGSTLRDDHEPKQGWSFRDPYPGYINPNIDEIELISDPNRIMVSRQVDPFGKHQKKTEKQFCQKKEDGYCACNEECGDFELTK